jgi:anti-sigma factor RsiW
MRKRATARRRALQKRTRHHDHKPGRCLNILRQLSAYIDNELPSKICDELRKHLGACPNCETFVASLRKAVDLCRHRPTPSLSASDRAEIRRGIIEAIRPGSRR